MKRIARQLVISFAAWTLVALVSYARVPLHALASGGSPPRFPTGLEPLISCWVWVPMTPPMLWMAERFPLERGLVWRNAAIHTFAAMFSVVVSAPPTWVLLRLFHAHTPPNVWSAMVAESFIDVFSYAAVIAVGHALTWQRISAQEQLRRSELEARLLEARMEALEARIHPHFLFNALNTVSSLIRTGDPKAALRAVARLGDLMRSLLLDDGQEIPLSQELEFIGRYLELEQARFGEKLSSKIDAQPEVMGALVPRLVLQPLVENAVRHGIEPSSDPGRVEVRAVRAGEMLEMEVLDTGPGLSSTSTPSTRIGLANTRARLEQLYGAKQQLALTRGDKGTIARVVIPFREQR